MKGVSNKIHTIEVSETNSPNTRPHRSVLGPVEKHVKKHVFSIKDQFLFCTNFLLYELAELKVSLVTYWNFVKTIAGINAEILRRHNQKI